MSNPYRFSVKNGDGEGHWCDECKTCGSCQGHGWVLSNNEAGYKDLQKCDACRVFEWDEDAQASALEYIKLVIESVFVTDSEVKDYIENRGVRHD